MTEQEAVEYLNRIYHQFTSLDEYGYVEDFEPYEKAINMAKESLEKQIPQSVKLYIGQDMQCPSCNNRLRNYEGVMIGYCKFCGQLLIR